MVMFLHTGGTLGPIPANISYLAVDLFFLLSGVVLANSYEKRLTREQISPTGLLLQRIIRLYPLYLLSLPIGLFSYALKNGLDYSTLADLLLRAILFRRYLSLQRAQLVALLRALGRSAVLRASDTTVIQKLARHRPGCGRHHHLWGIGRR